MNDMATRNFSASSDPPKVPARGPARWWGAVVIGCGLAIPFGILLSYVAFLMAYLGLFFYGLFGLLIGATVYRVASPAAPISKGALWAGTLLIVLTGIGTSLQREMADLPGDMANQALEALRRLPEGMTREEYRSTVARRVKSYLEENYPPGGLVGYARWNLDGGRFEAGTFEGVRQELSRSQRRIVWAGRVLLSIVLFGFGVSALTTPLAKSPSKPSHEKPTPSSS